MQRGISSSDFDKNSEMAQSDWDLPDDQSFTLSVDEGSVKTESENSNYNYTPQYAPTVEGSGQFTPTPQEFQFVDVAHHSVDSSVQLQSELKGDQPIGGHEYRQRAGAAGFLDKRGFGWLMEVDEDQDDFQKPLLEELDIDVKDIYYKLRAVMLPLPHFGFDSKVVRDNPDFWGPLVVVLLYSAVSLYGQFKVVSWILTIWIFGSMLVFLLARVLGGEVNYSQCLGVIGYSLLPLATIAVFLPLVPFHYLSILFKMCGVAWATYSAGSLLCVEELRHKRPLLLYPILLLYFYFLSLHTGA